MAVAEILHVDRPVVRLALVERHALVAFVGEAVFHVEQRAVRKNHVVAVGGIVVGELPVAAVHQPVGFAHHDLAAGMAVKPFVDRGA
jgi:hypothetical protein